MPRARAALRVALALAAPVAPSGCWPWGALTVGLADAAATDASVDAPSDVSADGWSDAGCDPGAAPGDAPLPRVQSAVVFYPNDAGSTPAGGSIAGAWVISRVTVALPLSYAASVDPSRSMVTGTGFVLIDQAGESDPTFRANVDLTEGLASPGGAVRTAGTFHFASSGRVSLLVGSAVLQLGEPGGPCPSLAVVFARASNCEADMTLVPRLPLLGSWVLRLYNANDGACHP